MSDWDEVKARVAQIAERPRNVELDEIVWVIKRLEKYFPVNIRDFPHGVIFRIADQRFTVTGHNPGSKQVKPCYVRKFLRAMTALGIYD